MTDYKSLDALDLSPPPMKVEERHRKYLDATYKFYRLDVVDQRIDYLRTQLKLIGTEDADSPKQELSGLEHIWASKNP